MRRQPTKDLNAALRRLSGGKSDLVSRGNYGGSIESDLMAVLRVVSAAQDIIARDREFHAWAQSYLSADRWAGHDRCDAIGRELLERDKQLERALEHNKRMTHAIRFALDDDNRWAEVREVLRAALTPPDERTDTPTESTLCTLPKSN